MKIRLWLEQVAYFVPVRWGWTLYRVVGLLYRVVGYYFEGLVYFPSPSLLARVGHYVACLLPFTFATRFRWALCPSLASLRHRNSLASGTMSLACFLSTRYSLASGTISLACFPSASQLTRIGHYVACLLPFAFATRSRRALSRSLTSLRHHNSLPSGTKSLAYFPSSSQLVSVRHYLARLLPFVITTRSHPALSPISYLLSPPL